MVQCLRSQIIRAVSLLSKNPWRWTQNQMHTSVTASVRYERTLTLTRNIRRFRASFTVWHLRPVLNMILGCQIIVYGKSKLYVQDAMSGCTPKKPVSNRTIKRNTDQPSVADFCSLCKYCWLFIFHQRARPANFQKTHSHSSKFVFIVGQKSSFKIKFIVCLPKPVVKTAKISFSSRRAITACSFSFFSLVPSNFLYRPQRYYILFTASILRWFL